MRATPLKRRDFLRATIALGAAGLAGCGGGYGAGDPEPVLVRGIAFAFDGKGNRYEMDLDFYSVRRVDAAGNSVWEQGSRDDPLLFNSPTAMAVDGEGTVYVADRGNGEIERLNASGVYVDTFGEELFGAQDLIIDLPTGRLYASDTTSHRVHVFTLDGRAVQTIGSFGTNGAGLNGPRGLAISQERELHVVDFGNARIQVFGLDGVFRRSFGGPDRSGGELFAPRDIVFDAAGWAIVTDAASGRLAWFDPRGVFQRHTTPRFPKGEATNPMYLAMDGEGRLWITVG